MSTKGLQHDSHHPTICMTSHPGLREWDRRDVGCSTITDTVGAGIIVSVIHASLTCKASRLLGDGGVLYVGSEPEYQLMHNTQGAAHPRRMSKDVVQVDPAVRCMLQLACGVAALHLTIESDSCTRTREHMQLGALYTAAAAVLCTQRNVGGGNSSHRVTQARSTGNVSMAVAYPSRPVTRC
jgi:hypothetical protein